MKVLVLGGTGEARALAHELVARHVQVVSSLAGRVRQPRRPEGEVRIGGFGGAQGLVAYLREEGLDAVVDATHPFSATISANATVACAEVEIPLLRLQRPGWDDEPGWHRVADHHEAAQLTATLGERPFLTVGRQPLAAFVGPLVDVAVLARVVDPPDIAVPSGWDVVLSRGPYDLAGERTALQSHAADVLVTKDSGGDHTRAKLDAARDLGVPVVVVDRPPAPAGVETVSDVDAAVRWLRTR